MALELIGFRHLQISVDTEENKRVYQQIEAGFVESCKCKNCIEFIRLREKIYPPEFINLLAQLGIDYTKEAEVINYGDLGEHWEGWFNFIGDRISPEIDRYDFEGEFSWWIKRSGGAVQKQFPAGPIASVEWSWRLPSKIQQAFVRT